MEEQFILRVPPSIAERIDRLLNDNASLEQDKSLICHSLMIMVREEVDSAADVEYQHGLTPPMRDARRRRLHREPDLNPELVRRVEKDLLKIIAGGTAENAASVSHVEVAEQDEGGRSASKKGVPIPAPKPDVSEAGTNAEEPLRSDSDESE